MCARSRATGGSAGGRPAGRTAGRTCRTAGRTGSGRPGRRAAGRHRPGRAPDPAPGGSRVVRRAGHRAPPYLPLTRADAPDRAIPCEHSTWQQCEARHCPNGGGRPALARHEASAATARGRTGGRGRQQRRRQRRRRQRRPGGLRRPDRRPRPRTPDPGRATPLHPLPGRAGRRRPDGTGHPLLAGDGLPGHRPVPGADRR